MASTPKEGDAPTHAGAVTFKIDGVTLKFLLVTASSRPDHWVFPKGHVEKGEALSRTALRELREEAGVEGEILCPLGVLDYPKKNKIVRVLYFLAQYIGSSSADEGRDILWCEFEEACRTVTFKDSKKLLEKARSLLTR